MGNVNMKPGVHLEGAGEYQTILRPVANNDKVLQYTAGATVNDIGLRKLGFDVNGKTNVTAIHLDGTDNAKRISGLNLKDLRISGAFVRGVYMRYCVNSGLQNIYQILVHDAFQLVESADSNLDDCEAQLGDGYGFLIQGGAGAFDEGVRMTKCITNGQAYGLSVSGQGWGNAAACSFTTAANGPLVLAGAENWDFSACEFSTAGGTPAAPAAQMDSACLDIGFASCKFILSTFGLILGGYRHNVVGCRFKANSNVDLQLTNASLCTAHANTMDSEGSTYSISESGSSDANSFVGNVENGLENIIGANSNSQGRIQY
ncbi:hypothetical protein CSC94_12805 [Zhengella mangrovi]|uniref:Right handed beta helix domain-containing protein n=2 Tax=Zhengella mangrovi TaxID=1982044 RepID=A0A2G1QM12_9HYPH|nr:hypothetical protein CSC94_12805 [Zhengella mangrovi]